MARASNFTDRQKADLFVRDHATCAYTGQNLWMLDHGVDPDYQIDWADHLIPVSKGGTSTLENGVCASWLANYDKLDKTSGGECLYRAGVATPTYFETRKSLSTEMATQFARFSRLHYSDWYFNRALFRMWLGIRYLSEKDNARSRDDAYYASASLKSISSWRSMISKESVLSLESRGLAPLLPTEDQKIMLRLREAISTGDIIVILKRLLPAYMAKVPTPDELFNGLSEGPSGRFWQLDINGTSFTTKRTRTSNVTASTTAPTKQTGRERLFEVNMRSSHKFWGISIAGNAIMTRFGKLGSDGEVGFEEYPDAAAANEDYEKLVKEKIKKGYEEK